MAPMGGSHRSHPAPPPLDCAPGPLLTVVGGYGGEGFNDEWTWRDTSSFAGADDDRTGIVIEPPLTPAEFECPLRRWLPARFQTAGDQTEVGATAVNCHPLHCLTGQSNGPPSTDPNAGDGAPLPGTECLRGEIASGFSLVISGGGSVDELVVCAQGRHVAALYALHEGDYVSYILGAPEFVNAGFRELFAGGVPPITPLVARSEGAPEANSLFSCLRSSGSKRIAASTRCGRPRAGQAHRPDPAHAGRLHGLPEHPSGRRPQARGEEAPKLPRRRGRTSRGRAPPPTRDDGDDLMLAMVRRIVAGRRGRRPGRVGLRPGAAARGCGRGAARRRRVARARAAVVETRRPHACPHVTHGRSTVSSAASAEAEGRSRCSSGMAVAPALRAVRGLKRADRSELQGSATASSARSLGRPLIAARPVRKFVVRSR